MKAVERTVSLPLRADGGLTLAVVADTHSTPHPNLEMALRELAPDAVLHAGDIGDFNVLERLAGVAPVHAVRGNIDVFERSIPDHLKIEIPGPSTDAPVFRILLTHIAQNGPKLRVDARRKAEKDQASLVVCGHSHIPFIGKEGALFVFNPGSAGPRRFTLPIVFGVLRLGGAGGGSETGRAEDARPMLTLQHVDLETGRVWTPPPVRSSGSRH